MDIRKMMTNGIYTMNGERKQSKKTNKKNTQKHKNISDSGSGSHANLLVSLMNLSVSAIFLLFTVKSNDGMKNGQLLV